MGNPQQTGLNLVIAEATDQSIVSSRPGQLIIEDSGDMYYDNSTSSERVKVGGDSFSNTTPTFSDFGGIPAGSTFDNVPVATVLNRLLYPHVDATVNSFTVTFSPTGVIECGTQVTYQSVAAKITKGTANYSEIQISDTDGAYIVDATKLTELNSSESGTVTWDFVNYTKTSGKSNTYRLTIKDADGAVITKTVSQGPTYVYPYYCGVINSDTIVTESVIESLQKKVESKGSKTISYTASSQRCVFASPYVVKTIKDPNGFDITSTFTGQQLSITGLDGSAQKYYIYVMNSTTTVTDFKITFTH